MSQKSLEETMKTANFSLEMCSAKEVDYLLRGNETQKSYEIFSCPCPCPKILFPVYAAGFVVFSPLE